MEIFLIKLLQFMLAISLLVLLHEGGHFFFAKLFKVRVNKFYLFFNPKFHIASTYDTWVRRLFGLKPTPVPRNDKGEAEYVGTEYGLGWLPLGGYCAIDGMVDETNQHLSDDPKPWEFRTKPTWQRLLIMVGGVLVNFLLALFIYSMIMYHWGESYYRVQDMTMGMKFSEDAKQLGFQDHDILLGTERGDFKDFNADLFRALATAQRVDVLRQGKKTQVNLPGNLNLLDMLKTQPKFVEPFVPPVIDSLMAGGPAATAGIMAGDTIVAINGKAVDSWTEYGGVVGRLEDMLSAAITPQDSLRLREVSVAVRHAIQANGSGTHADTLRLTMLPDLTMGIYRSSLPASYQPTEVHYGFFESFPAGVRYGCNVLKGYVGDLKYVFTTDGAKSLGGFGTIGNLFPATWDWHQFWMMTAFLSIILAFMNILPIPALDGGHVLFLLYEMITRRKPSDRFMVWAEYIGIGILVLLMVVANLNDVLRWLHLM